MEFTIESRKKSMVKFSDDLDYLTTVDNTSFSQKFTTNESLVKNLFDKKFISKGVEGSVYKSYFKNPHSFYDPVAIKISTIKKDKTIKKLSQKQIYKLFYTNKVYHTRNFIELVAQTLINQLVLQNICPNFLLNFYWEYDVKHLDLITYNEFANFGDFESWSKIKHTDIYWFNALFQILISLIAIKRTFNMLHNDLHTNNILVYKVKPGGHWTYIIDNIKYHVPNLGYVFFIHDFGFAYISNLNKTGTLKKQLYVDWHYNDTLKYITDIGSDFYDISLLIREWRNNDKVPSYFLKSINKIFDKKEIEYILSKRYYKLEYEYYKNHKPEEIKEYKQLLKNYPNITKKYNETHTTLTNKLYDIFHNTKNTLKSTSKFNINNIIYTKIPKNSVNIETYSLDKSFDKSKLPKFLQKIVK